MSLFSTLTYLFGTEEILNLRRQLVLLRERLMIYNCHDYSRQVYVSSGSLGEGVVYPRSDDDIMFFRSDTRVVRKHQEVTHNLDLVMARVKESPGYCLLLDIRGNYRSSMICQSDGINIISSTLWKQTWQREVMPADNIHGPCLSFSVGDNDWDFLICIQCSFWPDSACDWISRRRLYGWPSHETIQNIVRNKCHVVPVGDPDSSFNEHSWRISFSVAERLLMHSLTNEQFLIYNLLRLTLKRILDKEVPGVLCSYFMKTTLFYTIENSPAHLWKADNLEACFKVCLSTLYDFISDMVCPNYFIPEYNMMKRKLNHTNRRQLLDVIGNLHSIDAFKIMQLCREPLVARIPSQILEWKIDKDLYNSIHLCIVTGLMRDTIYTMNESMHFSVSPMIKYVHFLIENETFSRYVFSDILLQSLIVHCCLKLMDNSISSPCKNKQSYHRQKNIMSLLKIGYNGDVTTGRLTAATYMFLVGKTQTALSIVSQILAKYPRFVIDNIPNDEKAKAYLETMCGRGYPISFKAKHATAPSYTLTFLILDVFPCPLKIMISIGEFVQLPSIIYASVLECFCLIRLQDRLSVLKSINDLIKRIKLMKCHADIACSRICVGIIKYVQEEYQSACRWLGTGYIMKDKVKAPVREALSKTVLTYIACMINKNIF